MIEKINKTQTWLIVIVMLPLIILPFAPAYAGTIFTALNGVPVWYQAVIVAVVAAVLGTDIYKLKMGI